MNWTPTKNTHAGIYLQMDAETLSFTWSHTQSYRSSAEPITNDIKNLSLLPWFWRRTLIGFTLLLCLWLGVEVYISAFLIHITELLIMILDIWPLIDIGQVGNVLRFAENTTYQKTTQSVFMSVILRNWKYTVKK